MNMDYPIPETGGSPVRQTVADMSRQTPDSCDPIQVCKEPFIIGIAGGTASGKTTVCRNIMQKLGDQRVGIISLDEFYRDLTPEECANVSDVNFDEPAAFDVKSLTACLDGLRRCEPVEVPVYDFVTNKRCPSKIRQMSPVDVVIVEGILALHLPDVLKHCNMKIFVETDDDLRLTRRIRRDTVERGRDVEGVLTQYTRFVKPSFEKYVRPSKQNADLIIPWRDDNRVAVELISQHIRSKLQVADLRRIHSNLSLLESTMQTRAMHTVIRDRNTCRTDFVFYAERLMRLLVESALGQLPFTPCTVTTSAGGNYSGVKFAPHLCGVSLIRSGEAMENALRTVCNGVKIGKMLIQPDGDCSNNVIYEKLPRDIIDRHVLLMEPIVSTGSHVLHAIDRLINHHNVDEGKLIVLTLMAAPEGIDKICSNHPRLKLITTEIEESVAPDNTVRPGCGDFGDRFFGTIDNSEQQCPTLAKSEQSSNSSESR